MLEQCKGVHCVDLGESFQLFKRISTYKIWLRYSRERALKNLPHPLVSACATESRAEITVRFARRDTWPVKF